MKRALILHGTGGHPDSNWFPWLTNILEVSGYTVWAPQLPDAHMPNRQTWTDFILQNDFDLTDAIVIGHSAGAVEILNLLMDERMPHVAMGIMVGAWAGDVPDEYISRIQAAGMQREQFTGLFPAQGFNFSLIRSKADKLAFVHGDNDPFCPLNQAEYLANQLNAPLVIVQNGLHLSGNCTELPELLQLLHLQKV